MWVFDCTRQRRIWSSDTGRLQKLMLRVYRAVSVTTAGSVRFRGETTLTARGRIIYPFFAQQCRTGGSRGKGVAQIVDIVPCSVQGGAYSAFPGEQPRGTLYLYSRVYRWRPTNSCGGSCGREVDGNKSIHLSALHRIIFIINACTFCRRCV